MSALRQGCHAGDGVVDLISTPTGSDASARGEALGHGDVKIRSPEGAQ